ncbi:hypothetical protein M885DRAFT_550930 [Pelagophyceae sp. CCMP2097]|nr:hypothetical protein M885DRAFT_550930 [Pelagophyceae sp. CCMP2097]
MSEEAELNALQANIAKGGNNSYYYAHTKKANGPQWDGDPTPKLIERRSPSESELVLRNAITQFAWSDEGAKLRVYLPTGDFTGDGVQVDKEAVTLDWTEKSVALTIRLERQELTFSVPALYDKIAGASFRVKPGKVVLTLTKLPESTFKWHDIKK